jgi:hypothetical protein
MKLEENLKKELEYINFIKNNRKVSYKSLRFFKKTILVKIFSNYSFWINNIVYNLIIIFYSLKVNNLYFNDYAALDITNTFIDLSYIHNYIYILLVFYISNSFYVRNWHTSKLKEVISSIEGLFLNICSIPTNFNEMNINKTISCFKKISLFYILSQIENSDNIYTRENLLYPLIKNYSLTTVEEMTNVSISDKMKSSMCDALYNFPSYHNNHYQIMALSKIFENTTNIKLSYNYLIPFLYNHFMNFCVTSYLFMFAIYSGIVMTSDPTNVSLFSFIFGTIMIFFMNILTIGLLEIGRHMCDPINGEIDDFFVTTYSIELINNVIDILSTKFLKDGNTDNIEVLNYLQEIKNKKIKT